MPQTKPNLKHFMVTVYNAAAEENINVKTCHVLAETINLTLAEKFC